MEHGGITFLNRSHSLSEVEVNVDSGRGDEERQPLDISAKREEFRRSVFPESQMEETRYISGDFQYRSPGDQESGVRLSTVRRIRNEREKTVNAKLQRTWKEAGLDFLKKAGRVTWLVFKPLVFTIGVVTIVPAVVYVVLRRSQRQAAEKARQAQFDQVREMQIPRELAEQLAEQFQGSHSVSDGALDKASLANEQFVYSMFETANIAIDFPGKFAFELSCGTAAIGCLAAFIPKALAIIAEADSEEAARQLLARDEDFQVVRESIQNSTENLEADVRRLDALVENLERGIQEEAEGRIPELSPSLSKSREILLRQMKETLASSRTALEHFQNLSLFCDAVAVGQQYMIEETAQRMGFSLDQALFRAGTVGTGVGMVADAMWMGIHNTSSALAQVGNGMLSVGSLLGVPVFALRTVTSLDRGMELKSNRRYFERLKQDYQTAGAEDRQKMLQRDLVKFAVRQSSYQRQYATAGIYGLFAVNSTVYGTQVLAGMIGSLGHVAKATATATALAPVVKFGAPILAGAALLLGIGLGVHSLVSDAKREKAMTLATGLASDGKSFQEIDSFRDRHEQERAGVLQDLAESAGIPEEEWRELLAQDPELAETDLLDSLAERLANQEAGMLDSTLWGSQFRLNELAFEEREKLTEIPEPEQRRKAMGGWLKEVIEQSATARVQTSMANKAIKRDPQAWAITVYSGLTHPDPNVRSEMRQLVENFALKDNRRERVGDKFRSESSILERKKTDLQRAEKLLDFIDKAVTPDQIQFAIGELLRLANAKS